MAWIVLIISALLEGVWANALGASEGVHKARGPSLLFVTASIPGMITLAYVAEWIPMSTAYAVWAGLGATFTVSLGPTHRQWPATLERILLLLGIVASVVGLKLIKPVRKPTQEDVAGQH